MSAFILKIIASLAMLIDHTAAAFPGQMSGVMRMIGRLSFPIYAYLIAQGCVKTRDINKYLLRLGLFALISEIPFDLALHARYGIDFLSRTNVFYTLFLGAAFIAGYEKIKTKNGAWLFLMPLLLIPVLLGNILSTDYGQWGVIYIVLFYFAKPDSRVWRTIAMTFTVVRLYAFGSLNYFFFALPCVALVLLYNGERGPKKGKLLFYAFYPAHLALLALIRAVIS